MEESTEVLTPEEAAAARKTVKWKMEGNTIIIPMGMTHEEAILWHKRKIAEDEEEIAVNEEIRAFPFEAARAFSEAMARTYGWVQGVPIPGFFGSSPPQLVSVEVGYQKYQQVMWGRFEIPGISGYLETGIGVKDRLPMMVISGEVLAKHKGAVSALAELTRAIVANESIYKGQALTLKFSTPPAPGKPAPFDPDCYPRFLDLSRVVEEDLIFEGDLQDRIWASVFAPVIAREQCMLLRTPLARKTLFEGPYGCGKTQTMYVLAKKCVENGVTFLYVERLRDLPQAFLFAKQYAPVYVACEDLDVLSATKPDDPFVTELRNVLDGITSKDSGVSLVMTTNHVDSIEASLLRHGRFDDIIHIGFPGPEAVQRLARQYGRGLIPADENLNDFGEALGHSVPPATVREAIESAKLFAAVRCHRLGIDAGSVKLIAQDLNSAANRVLDQARRAEPKKQDTRSERERAAEIMGKHLVAGIKDAMGFVAEAPKLSLDGNLPAARTLPATHTFQQAE